MTGSDRNSCCVGARGMSSCIMLSLKYYVIVEGACKERDMFIVIGACNSVLFEYDGV